MGDRLRRAVRQQARKAGRQYAESVRAYREGRDGDGAGGDGDDGGEGSDGRDGGAGADPPPEDAERVPPATFDLPDDGDGAARIVCRRHVERRAVPVDEAGRPDCFEAGNPDCEGCREDVCEGRVETW
ncbi:hypothetical protein RYH80_07465 [Halobaculum sp. MBLA0147]|uniref:DUF7091 family protein n=1 Tax=Halobaculum sp. MBLA0147 TaxID=3079934 RepID=UPI0035258335